VPESASSSLADGLARYQALLELTQQMLSLARAEDWDALQALLPEQERIMAGVPNLAALLPENSTNDIAQLLRNIDTANQEVIYRIGVRQAEILQITGEVSVARHNVNRLGRAYRY